MWYGREVEVVRHKNFHTLRLLKGKPGGGAILERFILEEWRPKQDIFIIGAQIGLLCQRNENYEIYLSVSRNPKLTPSRYFVGLKQDYLFYAQRDVYSLSTGPGDLTKEIFLPSGTGFLIKEGKPVYIKVGAANAASEDLYYDAFCNLYYVNATE